MLPDKVRWEDPFAAEQDLLHEVGRRLVALLGDGWGIDEVPTRAGDADAVWRVRSPVGEVGATVIVEATLAGVAPRSVERVAHRIDRTREVADVPGAVGLLVAPYLSPRVRQVLTEHELHYFDLTGNISFRLASPLVVVRTDGAQRDPAPAPRGRRGMSGPRAGRLVRDLVDRRPPRRGTELAEATGLSESYVSRLLELFAEESFIRRRHRVVTEVYWPSLLRARASSYELMKVNHVVPAIARRSLGDFVERLRVLARTDPGLGAPESPVLATGTFAANGFAPLAAGGAMYLYVPTFPGAVDTVCKQLGLMRVEQQATADVLLLQPMNDTVFVNPHRDLVDGVRIAALSQVVLDCLAGPGRLPAAGEELIAWMGDHEEAWREDSPLPEAQ